MRSSLFFLFAARLLPMWHMNWIYFSLCSVWISFKRIAFVLEKEFIFAHSKQGRRPLVAIYTSASKIILFDIWLMISRNWLYTKTKWRQEQESLVCQLKMQNVIIVFRLDTHRRAHTHSPSKKLIFQCVIHQMNEFN